MIDPLKEKLMTLEQARHHPLLHHKRRNGKPMSYTALYKQAKRGVRGIRLETLDTGDGLATSAEAIARFFERLTMARTPAIEPTASEAREGHERAKAKLRARGLC